MASVVNMAAVCVIAQGADRQGGGAFTMLAVVTRAREAGRRDADRSARPARAVQRLLAARFDGEVAGGAVGSRIPKIANRGRCEIGCHYRTFSSSSKALACFRSSVLKPSETNHRPAREVRGPHPACLGSATAASLLIAADRATARPHPRARG